MSSVPGSGNSDSVKTVQAITVLKRTSRDIPRHGQQNENYLNPVD